MNAPESQTPDPERRHEFYTRHSESLQMKLLGPCIGFDRRIREPTINRPGLALSGFFSYFADRRIQILGERGTFVSEEPLRNGGSCPLSGPQRPANSLPGGIALGQATGRPFRRGRGGRRRAFFHHADGHDEIHQRGLAGVGIRFLPRRRVNDGSMMDIVGVGTLVRGSSGSARVNVCSLIERGHSLVSDDVTRFRAWKERELVGTSPDLPVTIWRSAAWG